MGGHGHLKSQQLLRTFKLLGTRVFPRVVQGHLLEREQTSFLAFPGTEVLHSVTSASAVPRARPVTRASHVNLTLFPNSPLGGFTDPPHARGLVLSCFSIVLRVY